MKTINYFFISLLFIISCENRSSLISSDTENEYLYQKWVNSFEEQKDSVQIYRPDGFSIYPSSRYREEIEFQKDGICRYFVLSSVDAHYVKRGTWVYDHSNEHQIVICDHTTAIYKKFEIIELNQNVLKIVFY